MKYLVIAALVAAPSLASAGKPSAAAAGKAAAGWLQSLYGKDDAKVLGAIDFPFVSVAYEGDEEDCKAASIADAAGMAGADGRLQCIRENVYHDGTPVALTAKIEKALGHELATHVKDIDAVGKTATLVIIQGMTCPKDSMYSNVVIAVRNDARGVAKIAGLWSQNGLCQ